MKYLRRNVLCGLRARAGHGRASEHQRVWEVANQRMHGTTHEPAIARREAEQLPTKPIGGRPLYPHVGKELRQVAREAFVHWRGSCYSVPWAYAGKLVGVCQQAGRAQVRHGADCIAKPQAARRKHLFVIELLNHAGIPLEARQRGKTWCTGASVLEVRLLAACESLAGEGRDDRHRAASSRNFHAARVASENGMVTPCPAPDRLAWVLDAPVRTRGNGTGEAIAKNDVMAKQKLAVQAK